MAYKVHRVRYYNPKPQIINCVSFNKKNKHIALARGDASVEVWDLNYAPYLIKFIPGVQNGSVEALGWVGDRLLSTGLGGALVEWDMDKLCVKTTVLLTGYAAWCLDVNVANTMVAVGTEQGYVNLYNVENDEIVYLKLFDKQEGRIMCCKFNSAGTILATGSIDNIRVWNVQTGHAVSRMSVTKKGKETIVWCLAVLSDSIIVSGDSHGRLSFWDGTLGEQVECFPTHKADILSIAVSDKEDSLYCSGVDPVITNFIKVNDKQNEVQWVKNVQRHIHEHDVRALALNGDKLVSLGADGYLTLSSYPPKWVMRIPYMIPAPRSSLCAKKKLFLLRYSNYIEVWKLGSYAVNQKGNILYSNTDTRNDSEDVKANKIEQDSRITVLNEANMILNTKKQTLRLNDNPMKLVSIQAKGQLRCCEMSPTGEFIFYSTDSHIRMLKLETDDDQMNTSLSKLMVSGLPSCCDRVAFTEDSRTMVAYCAGCLHVLHVDPLAGATAIYNINVEKHLKTTSILHLYISKKTNTGATYLIVADTLGAIAVWVKGEKKFEHYVSLPRYKCIPSALTVNEKKDVLIVTYVDQKILEYQLVEKKFTEWFDWLPSEWLHRNSAVVSITVHPIRDALIFQDETALWIMEPRNQAEICEPQKKKKLKNKKRCPFSLRILPIKYLAGFHWISQEEAATLEILPENIVSQLPPAMVRK